MLSLVDSPRAPLREEAAVASLPEGVDQRLLLEHLERHRIVGLLGSRLLQTAADVVDPSLSDAIERRLRFSERVGTAHAMTADAILDRLTRAGIAATWLKGARLAEEAHGDVALRESADIDLLVGPDDLSDAATILEELGWTPFGDWTDRNGLPRLHLSFVHQGMPVVEVHWRVHWYESVFAAQALGRGRAESKGGVRLQDEDVLLFLLLFYARDGLAGLRLAMDALAWANRPTVDQTTLATRIVDNPSLQPALLAAAHAVACIAGRNATILPHREDLGMSAKAAVLLADPLLRLNEKQRSAETALIDLLLAPPGERARACRRQLLPPAAVLQQASRPPRASRPRAAAARVEHALRITRRFSLAPFEPPTALEGPG